VRAVPWVDHPPCHTAECNCSGTVVLMTTAPRQCSASLPCTRRAPVSSVDHCTHDDNTLCVEPFMCGSKAAFVPNYSDHLFVVLVLFVDNWLCFTSDHWSNEEVSRCTLWCHRWEFIPPPKFYKQPLLLSPSPLLFWWPFSSWTWVSSLLVFFLCLFWNRTFWDKWHRFLPTGDSSLTQLVSWSLTSLFSTNTAISETKGQGWRVNLTLWRKASNILTSTLAAFLFSSHPKRERDREAHLNYYASAYMGLVT